MKDKTRRKNKMGLSCAKLRSGCGYISYDPSSCVLLLVSKKTQTIVTAHLNLHEFGRTTQLFCIEE